MSVAVRPIVASILLTFAIPAIARADIVGFGDFSGFSVNQSDPNSAPNVAPGLIHLTNQGSGEVRSIFSLARQDISKFSASFTYRALGNPQNVQTFGACFVVHTSVQGATVVSHDLGGVDPTFGYTDNNGTIHPSAAISLEYGHLALNSSSTGLYTNANVGNGALSTSPLNLFSGDPINATITYDGHLLTEMLTDNVTNGSFTSSYIANLPSILGSSTAYVGFTANTKANAQGAQDFSGFQFTSGAVPEPSGTFAIASLSGLLMTRRRR